jgi:hypothetical protein
MSDTDWVMQLNKEKRVDGACHRELAVKSCRWLQNGWRECIRAASRLVSRRGARRARAIRADVRPGGVGRALNGAQDALAQSPLREIHLLEGQQCLVETGKILHRPGFSAVELWREAGTRRDARRSMCAQAQLKPCACFSCPSMTHGRLASRRARAVSWLRRAVNCACRSRRRPPSALAETQEGTR